jgi:hypothetical protein
MLIMSIIIYDDLLLMMEFVYRDFVINCKETQVGVSSRCADDTFLAYTGISAY